MTRTAVSLFAGVGGFDLALERAGVKVVASVEIDKHAWGILSQRFPDSKLFEDVRKVTGDELRAAGFISDGGIITGGFPCQDLSVAGKRAGFTGERSSLFYEIARIADETQAEWLVLENVPGLLTSQRGADMGAVIGTLADLGYVGSWRVLDAQHFGVPQRRRRVFIVARRAGDPTSCAEILFEPTSLRGNPASSRASGQETTGGAGEGAEVAGALTMATYRMNDFGGYAEDDDTSSTLRARDYKAATDLVIEPEPVIVGPLTALGMAGAKGTETTDSHHYVLEPIVNRMTAFGQYANDDDTSSALCARDYKDATDLVIEPTLYEPHHSELPALLTMREGKDGGGKGPLIKYDSSLTLATANNQALFSAGAVRRLTPTECERLQGFPDGWTEGQADSHRYKQMGNAVAVPVVEWIINRLVEFD